MSTSLLYHGFGLVEQEYMKTEYKGGTIIFHVRTKAGHYQCSSCDSKNVIKKGVVERIFRTVPIGLKPVFIHAHLHRLQCNKCGALKLEKLHFADQKKDIP
jgi:transposase